MYACVCLFTNFIQFWVWLKMVERPPHDHFAGKMMKNNLLELGVYMFKYAHVDLPGRVFLQWYSLDTSSVRWSVGIGCSPPFCWTFDALDRAGLNIRPPNNIQPQNDPRSARNDTIEKKKIMPNLLLREFA